MPVSNERAGRQSVARRPGGRSARVRRLVLDATLALIANDGFQSLTIDSVASLAGVNKTTIYRNWPSKTALILDAARDRSESMITTRITGDPERDLVALLGSVAENITSPVGRALVIATLNGADDAEVREARDEFWRGRFEAARDLVRAAINDGILSDSEVDAFIERLVAPLYLRVFITGMPVDDAFIREMVTRALRSIS
jgi:AcrR family transcriptional regulator